MRTDNPGASNERACTTKKAYTDERIARRVAAKVRDRSDADVVHYACTRCGQWHVGRRPGSGDRS